MHMKTILTMTVAFLVAIGASAAPKQYGLQSPDGRLYVKVEVGKGISYTLVHDGALLLSDSPVSMTLEGGAVYGDDDKVVKAVRRSVDQTIKAVLYRKAEVKDAYNELALKF
ncbi:glycoside hydrolase family 97 N-terminal domain-containing protein, partial [Klebsiella pneumoniae]|uniref:glycoside hydrolase family 97 N-terminal domain-containing protein n=1 Tax=Klebsiella pneumoniae TaxID=573 RepID=UPI00163D60CE